MPPRSPDDPLEAALDELYGVDAGEFVGARKRLVAELRGAGDKDAAKALAAARRPTTAAWALNQLRRQDPHRVEEFFDLSRVLEVAQSRATPSGRDAMRDATKAQREALAALTESAMAILGPGATEATRSQIRSTLQAASADTAVAEDLEHGRLVKEVSGATGFPGVPGLTLVPDLEPDRVAATAPMREKPARAKPLRDPAPAKRAPVLKTAKIERVAAEARRREAREREAVARAEQRRKDAEAAAESAQAEADEAKQAATAAHERVGALEQELTEARRAAREADTRAGKAHRDAGRLARDAAKLKGS